MIGVINTQDKRYDNLINNLQDVIYSNKLTDFNDLDVLVLPLNGVDAFLFIKDTNLNVMDFYIKKGPKKIIAGKINQELIDFCKNEEIELTSYLEDECYLWENSKLTSEALIKKILYDLDDALYKKRLLILGYGYQAKALYNYLSPFTNNIAIYASDYHDKKELFCKNIERNDLTDLNFDIIINTVPYNIIDEKNLNLINDKCLIYDVASYPYGFSEECLKKIKITVLPKLPSLYMPKKAGEILASYILNIIKQ